MSITGDAEGAPFKSGVALVDVLTAKDATIAILAALAARQQTGRGSHVQVNLLSSLQGALANQGQAYLGAGVVPGRMGNEHPSICPVPACPVRRRAVGDRLRQRPAVLPIDHRTRDPRARPGPTVCHQHRPGRASEHPDPPAGTGVGRSTGRGVARTPHRRRSPRRSGRRNRRKPRLGTSISALNRPSMCTTTRAAPLADRCGIQPPGTRHWPRSPQRLPGWVNTPTPCWPGCGKQPPLSPVPSPVSCVQRRLMFPASRCPATIRSPPEQDSNDHHRFPPTGRDPCRARRSH